MKKEKILDVVWDNGGTKRRYIPRSVDGGPSWMVWDRLESRFVDKADVHKIDPYEEVLSVQ